MNAPTTLTQPTAPELAEWTINDLVTAYPETMQVLAPLGIDLCCGGLHQLGDALDRHGHDRAAVLEQVAAVVGRPDGER